MTIGYQLEYTKKNITNTLIWDRFTYTQPKQYKICVVSCCCVEKRHEPRPMHWCTHVSVCVCGCVWYILWFIYWHTAWTKWARVEWICIVRLVSMQWIPVAPSIVHFHFMSRTRKSPSKTSQIPLAFLCSVQSFVFHDAYILQAIVLIGIIRILWNFEKSPKYTPDRKSAHCLTS